MLHAQENCDVQKPSGRAVQLFVSGGVMGLHPDIQIEMRMDKKNRLFAWRSWSGQGEGAAITKVHNQKMYF
jgi:hypothetical protein